MCHELATQVNTSLWGQNELHNDWGDELFTRRLPLKIGNEQRCGYHQAATATNIMHAHRLTQKNIEFLSFDRAENEFHHENESYFLVSQNYFHN